MTDHANTSSQFICHRSVCFLNLSWRSSHISVVVVVYFALFLISFSIILVRHLLTSTLHLVHFIRFGDPSFGMSIVSSTTSLLFLAYCTLVIMLRQITIVSIPYKIYTNKIMSWVVSWREEVWRRCINGIFLWSGRSFACHCYRRVYDLYKTRFGYDIITKLENKEEFCITSVFIS